MPIDSATDLEKISGVSFRIAISHYFCELATNNLMNKKYGLAKTYLKKALEESKKKWYLKELAEIIGTDRLVARLQKR